MKQKIFRLLGIASIIFVCFEVLATPILQQRAQVIGATQLSERFNIANGAIGHPDLSPLPNEPDAIGDAIALIKIPKLKIEQVVFEGGDSEVTQKGIGHFSGSSGIAEYGMSILVGRRMTWGASFHNLDKLNIGDKLTTLTVAGPMDYKVTKLNASIEDLNAQYSKSMLALVTSTPEGISSSDYIVLAKATKPPYLSIPQNRYSGKGLREGSFNFQFILYLILLIGLMFFWNKFSIIFGKPIAWAIFMPTGLSLMILFVRELDKLMPPTL